MFVNPPIYIRFSGKIQKMCNLSLMLLKQPYCICLSDQYSQVRQCMFHSVTARVEPICVICNVCMVITAGWYHCCIL